MLLPKNNELFDDVCCGSFETQIDDASRLRFSSKVVCLLEKQKITSLLCFPDITRSAKFGSCRKITGNIDDNQESINPRIRRPAMPMGVVPQSKNKYPERFSLKTFLKRTLWVFFVAVLIIVALPIRVISLIDYIVGEITDSF